MPSQESNGFRSSEIVQTCLDDRAVPTVSGTTQHLPTVPIIVIVMSSGRTMYCLSSRNLSSFTNRV